MQIQGAKEEMLPGVTWGLPCSLIWISPVPKEPRVQGRGDGHWRSQFGGATRIGARGHLLSQGVSWEFGGREWEGAPPEPPVEELWKWVPWKADACETPSWWRELMMVPGVDDHQKLAWEVQASFWLPKRVSKSHQMENYQQAPPAPLCLLQKNFLPPPNSIFACQDIWEIQLEKMVAYAQALQFWAEKIDPPTKGKPCLLVDSVKELWEEILPLLLQFRCI